MVWENMALGDVFLGKAGKLVEILYSAYLIIPTLLVGPLLFRVGLRLANLKIWQQWTISPPVY